MNAGDIVPDTRRSYGTADEDWRQADPAKPDPGADPKREDELALMRQLIASSDGLRDGIELRTILAVAPHWQVKSKRSRIFLRMFRLCCNG